MNTKHFINLTNGIQAIEDYKLSDYSFIRIQSTACEQKRFEEILITLSDDFLMSCAMGRDCIVYDYGANRIIPRAIWQGLEWVKFVLYKRWYNVDYKPMGRSNNAGCEFRKHYKLLHKTTKRRIDYFFKFLDGPLTINSVTTSTTFDNKYNYYANIIKKTCKKEKL